LKNNTQSSLPTNTHPLYTKFNASRNLTWLLYSSVIATFFIAQLTRPLGANWVIFILQISPLIAFLPSLMTEYYRAYSWLCFIILLYFIVSVMNALASNAKINDYVMVILIPCLFTSSMMCSRYAQRIQKNIIS